MREHCCQAMSRTNRKNYHRFLLFHYSIFSLVLVSIERKCKALKEMFVHASKHFRVCQKYSTTPPIFNFLLGVWKFGQT